MAPLRYTPNSVYFTQTNLFVSGKGAYHSYRIPAVLATAGGTVLAFCEGRCDSNSDFGEIDILVRRSHDYGKNWDVPQVVVSHRGFTCGNPCVVEDRSCGRILLLFCKNPAEAGEEHVVQGRAERTVWVSSSDDDGASWSTPREITQSVKQSSWTWYATGPGHGIQLAGGRLVVACDHIRGLSADRARDPIHSHLITSDDGGGSWRIGGIVEAATDECAVAETVDGRLYLTCRAGWQERENFRGLAWSDDGGDTLSQLEWDRNLVDPVCQAGLVGAPPAVRGAPGTVFFSNPAASDRRNLTVRMSTDGCLSWPVARSLHAGPAAYSDLAVLPNGSICCLYEGGTEHPYEWLRCAIFDLAWLNDRAGLTTRPSSPH